MPRLLVAPASGVGKVFPVDGVAWNRLEHDAAAGVVIVFSFGRSCWQTTLEVLAPLLVTWKGHPHKGKLGASALEPVRGVDPGHEAAYAAPAIHVGAPVKVVAVVAAARVALRAQTFDPDVVAPALKGSRPRLDASHRVCPREEGHLRVANGCVAGRGVTVVCDGGGFKDGVTGSGYTLECMSIIYIRESVCDRKCVCMCV